MGDGEMADLEKNVGLLSNYIRVPPDEERFYKKKQSSEKYLKNGLILVGTSLLIFWLTWLTIRTGAADRDSLGDILATEELLELKQLQSQLHFQLMNKTGADHLDSLDAAVITSELQKLKQEIKNHERDARQLITPTTKECPDLEGKSIPILQQSGFATQKEPQCLEDTYWENVGSCQTEIRGEVIVLIHDVVFDTPSGQKGGSGLWLETKNKLLAQDSITGVIVVDWSKGADLDIHSAELSAEEMKTKPKGEITERSLEFLLKHPLYEQAAMNAVYIGVALSSVLNELSVGNIHCIGHGVGAHSCGFLGKELKKMGKQPYKISALDPAGPLFLANKVRNHGDNPEHLRLSKADAHAVDVVHTDTRLLGSNSTIGNYDFFPGVEESYGYSQPQPGKTVGPLQSHFQAIAYYSETIDGKCVVDGYCIDEDEKVVLCSALPEELREFSAPTVLGYSLDPDRSREGSFNMDVTTGPVIALQCKDLSMTISTEGIAAEIESLASSITDMFTDPTKMRDPKVWTDVMGQVAGLVTKTIKNVEDFKSDLDATYEETFNLIDEMATDINEKTKESLAVATHQLGDVSNALFEGRQSVLTLAERTIRGSKGIINLLDYFKAAPAEENEEILKILIDDIKKLLKRSVNSLTNAKEKYHDARKSLQTIAATLTNVKRDITVTQKLLTAKNMDEVRELEKEASSRKKDSYMKWFQLTAPIGTTVEAAFDAWHDTKSKTKTGMAVLNAFTNLGPISNTILSALASMAEAGDMEEKGEEIKRKTEECGKAVGKALEKITESQDITKKELDAVKAEEEILRGWLQHVEDMREDFGCVEGSDCDELRDILGIRFQKLKANQLEPVIEKFKELKEYAEDYKAKVTSSPP